MRITLIFLLLILPVRFAAGMETVISPPDQPVHTGDLAELSICRLNSEAEPASAVLPPRITCRVPALPSASFVATAVEPKAQSALLEKNQYLCGRYAFLVPDGLTGPVRLEFPEWPSAGAMLYVLPAAFPGTRGAETQGGPSEEADVTLESLSTLYQPYLVNLSAYQPMYFLVGTDPKKSKFQISLKYRLLNTGGSFISRHPSLRGIYMAYTQTSFWDLKADSAPFEDTSYKPELFFVTPNIKFRPSWMKGLFVQTGTQHESNGLGGDQSRSTNYAYIKPMMIFFNSRTRYGLLVSPRFQAYIGNDNETNPDLADYRGYAEIEIKAGKAERLVVGSLFRFADQGTSVRVDLTYPIHGFISNNVNLYLQAQYANMLAESLLDYRSRTHAVRFGFSIVR